MFKGTPELSEEIKRVVDSDLLHFTPKELVVIVQAEADKETRPDHKYDAQAVASAVRRYLRSKGHDV